MSKPPKKRIHRPPPVDGMAACVVLQKGKWSRFQVGCMPIDEQAYARIAAGCGPKCVTDFASGKTKAKKAKKDSGSSGIDVTGLLPFLMPPVAPAPSAPPPPAAAAPAAPTDPAAPPAPKDPRQENSLLVGDPAPLGKSFKVTWHDPPPGATQTAKGLKKLIDEEISAFLRDHDPKVPISADDKQTLQKRINDIARAAARRPTAPATGQPSTFRDWDKQVTNPTGLSGLERRPTMARRKKSCAVLRKQGKKLPARCKGTKKRRK